jgi:hypothetical protein
MTVIHDLEAPEVTIDKPRSNDPVKVRNRLVVLLCASAVVLSGVNLIASFRLYSAANQVSELNVQLGQLAAFEKRITDKINLVNVGLQNQFDNLDASVASRFAETGDGIGAVEKQLSRIGNAVDPGGQSASGAAPADEGMASAGPTMAEIEPVRAGLPTLSPAYQRIETPEGKVTYRKIR